MSPGNEDIRDRIMLSVSDTDHLKFRQLAGIGVLADPGGGKSSTVGKQIFQAFARAGCGILAHAMKADDTAMFQQWARECGRVDDVIVFNEASGMRFDALAYEYARTGERGGGDAESVIGYFSTLMSLSNPHGGGNGDRFWEQAPEQAMRHSVKLIQLANHPLSIVTIYQTISSFPEYFGQQDDPEWADQSFVVGLIKEIRARKATLTTKQWDDLDTATAFVFKRWPTLDGKLSSSIAMTFAATCDKFLFHPLREIFASGVCDFTPEQITHERKIVLLDYPVMEYGRELARLIHAMVQLTSQRAFLRHQYKPGCCNGALLYMDECQLLMHKHQNQFVQASRSTGVCVLAMTQTILNLAEELGEDKAGAKTRAFLANLGVKITLRSTCPDTCTYMSDVIGKSYRYIENFNSGTSGDAGSTHTGFGGSKQLVYQVEPHEFSSLARPSGESKLAEGIVFCGGDHFNATRTAKCPQGLNHMRVHFSRKEASCLLQRKCTLSTYRTTPSTLSMPPAAS